MALKFKTRASLKLPKDVWLRDIAPSALHPLASSKVPPLTSLFFFTQTHFSPLSTSFYSKGMFVFLTGGRTHVTATEKKKKKASSPLGRMSGAFEQFCWSNLQWGFGHWRTPYESEQEWKERKGNTGEKRKKSVPLFPKAMKRDFDFLEKNQVSSPQLFLKWDFVCSWWSVILQFWRLQGAEVVFPSQSS